MRPALARAAMLVLALAGIAAWMPLAGTALCSALMLAVLPYCYDRSEAR